MKEDDSISKTGGSVAGMATTEEMENEKEI